MRPMTRIPLLPRLALAIGLLSVRYGVDSRPDEQRRHRSNLLGASRSGGAAEALRLRRAADGASRRGAARGTPAVGCRRPCASGADGPPPRPARAIRSVASSRLRSCERSSWAIARTTGPSRSSTRVRSASVERLPRPRRRRAPRRASSSSARAGRPARSTARSGSATSDRIDSASMAAILLDVDGVLHVSGEPIPGAVDAVRRLRAPATASASSRTRRRCRAPSSASRSARWASALDDDELQTTGGVAAARAGGQARARADDAGHPRRPRGPRADRHERRRRARRRLRRGRGARPRLLVPEPEPRLPRARGRAPSSTACTRTAGGRRPTGPKLDAGAFVAGLEYAAGDRGDRARQAEPRVLRARRSRRSTPTPSSPGWSATTSRATSAAHSGTGCAPCSCARASSAPTRSSTSGVHAGRDRLVDRAAPRLARSESLMRARARPDRDRARAPRARAPRRRLPRALLHAGRARAYCDGEGESCAALRRPIRREGSGRQGARLRRPLHLEGDRDQRPPEARRPALRSHGASLPSALGAEQIELSA